MHLTLVQNLTEKLQQYSKFNLKKEADIVEKSLNEINKAHNETTALLKAHHENADIDTQNIHTGFRK